MRLNDVEVCIVSVDSGPVLYNIDCTACDDLVAEDTEDLASLELLVEPHLRSHF